MRQQELQRTFEQEAEESCRCTLSALVDDEVTDADLDALLGEQVSLADYVSHWSVFELIGAALRREYSFTPSSLPLDFPERVRQGLLAHSQRI